MHQRNWTLRAPTTGGRPSHARPWVLVEDAAGVAQVSDFSLFDDAGFDVAVCSGPDGATPCPLVTDGRCTLADSADVVLFALDLHDDAGRAVLRVHRRHHPATPVVVAPVGTRPVAIGDDGGRVTILPVGTTVGGQIRALWNAVCADGSRRRRGSAAV